MTTLLRSFSNHNSESEQEADEILEQDSEAEQLSDFPYFLKKDKNTNQYKKKGKTSIRTRYLNIVRYFPVAKDVAMPYKTPIEIFRYIR